MAGSFSAGCEDSGRGNKGRKILTSVHLQEGKGESEEAKLLLNEVGFFFFCLFTATPAAYGGSQARGLIGATAAGLYHGHSNTGSEPCL